MRKVYVKPEIEFEDFSLSTNIAGGCDRIVNNASKGTCGILGSGGETIFGGVNYGGCSFDVMGMNNGVDDYDGFCYHNPTETNNLFNS